MTMSLLSTDSTGEMRSEVKWAVKEPRVRRIGMEPRALLVANRIGSPTRKYGTTGMCQLVFSLFHAELYLHQREYHADYFFWIFSFALTWTFACVTRAPSNT